jgi:hypothetical protein
VNTPNVTNRAITLLAAAHNAPRKVIENYYQKEIGQLVRHLLSDGFIFTIDRVQIERELRDSDLVNFEGMSEQTLSDTLDAFIDSHYADDYGFLEDQLADWLGNAISEDVDYERAE